MSKHGNWTIVFDDQMIIKRINEFNEENALGYQCGGTDFWNQAKFSNLHAIQFTNDNEDNDQVEYKDTRPNSAYDVNTLGSFQQFIDLWDSKHLSILQENWDNNNIQEETPEQKVIRLGERPISYTS
jgi:hypothetical protein